MWLWQDRYVAGYLNLILGEESVGKGALAAWTIARLTKGELLGAYFGEPVNAAVVADEDDWDGVWGPRLHAAGADLTRVVKLETASPGRPAGAGPPPAGHRGRALGPRRQAALPRRAGRSDLGRRLLAGSRDPPGAGAGAAPGGGTRAWPSSGRSTRTSGESELPPAHGGLSPVQRSLTFESVPGTNTRQASPG